MTLLAGAQPPETDCRSAGAAAAGESQPSSSSCGCCGSITTNTSQTRGQKLHYILQEEVSDIDYRLHVNIHYIRQETKVKENFHSY